MDGTEVDIRGILGLLRRQLRLILITLGVVLAGVSIIVFSLTPIYSSSALITVDPSNKNLLEPDLHLSSPSADNSRIDSEVEILRSEATLLKVIAAEHLIDDPEFGVSAGLRERVLELFGLAQPVLPTGEETLNEVLVKLGNAVTAQRRGLTYLISVQASSIDPDTAARLANAMAQVYIRDQLAIKVDSITAARDILQARIIGARTEIIASDGLFDTFIAANIDRIGRAELSDLRRQIDDLNRVHQQTAASVGEVQTNLEPANWVISDTFGPQALPDQTTQVSALRSGIIESQAQEDALRQQLRQQVLASALPVDVLTDIYELQQNAELARAQYKALLARTQDLDTQANLQIADSRIVSPALPPRTPSFPNRALMLALAALAALGIGIGLAYLYENLIGGFTTEEQAVSVLKTRIAAAIPRVRAQADMIGFADLMVEAPLSKFAEAIRRIRAIVDQEARAVTNPGAGDGRVVMISSTASGEGKTTLALALARSYALSGRRVVLIDCDLRKPGIHRHIGIEPSCGLHDLLDDFDSWGLDVAAITSVDTLSKATIIVGARRSEFPTDQLLASASFDKLIDAARQTFEIVILDTPPIGPVVDGFYVAPFADVIVFAIRWASTAQLEARKALAALNAAKRPNAAVVAALNLQGNTDRDHGRIYGGAAHGIRPQAL